MRENKTILAGEDSGGLSVGEHIPEKDGFVALLTLLDLVATEGKPIGEILSDVNEKIGGEWKSKCNNFKFKTDEKDAYATDKLITAIITAIIYFMLLIAFSILLFTHGKKLFYKLKQ